MYSGSQVVPVMDPTRCCTDRWPVGKSSMKMMGSRMAVELDSGGGQVLNSRALENEEDGQRCRQTFQFTHVMNFNSPMS